MLCNTGTAAELYPFGNGLVCVHFGVGGGCMGIGRGCGGGKLSQIDKQTNKQSLAPKIT